MDLIYLTKKELFRRNYSIRTIKSYAFCLDKFLQWCKKEPRELTKVDIRRYLYHLCSRNKSASTLNVNLQAIKFALEEILNKRFFVRLPYSKVSQRLPEALSKREVVQLIAAIPNKKHQLMVKLLYSAGLRVSELVNLKVRDLDFENNTGWVRHGKGNKDRPFIIATAIKDELSKRIEEVNLNYSSWLFPGRGTHLHTRSVQEIIKKATVKARLRKNVHPHTLRHSFATHLIENGYDVATVQSLLGHNSAETTMVYVHMAKPKLLAVKSPYDSLTESFK